MKQEENLQELRKLGYLNTWLDRHHCRWTSSELSEWLNVLRTSRFWPLDPAQVEAALKEITYESTGKFVTLRGSGASSSFNNFSTTFRCSTCGQDSGTVEISCLAFVTSSTLIGYYCLSCNHVTCVSCQKQAIDEHLQSEGITHIQLFPSGGTFPIRDNMDNAYSYCLNCRSDMTKVGRRDQGTPVSTLYPPKSLSEPMRKQK